MAMKDVKTVSDLNYGAVDEQFGKAWEALIQNMLDPATEAKRTRTLTITVKVTPSEDRNMAQTEVDVKTSLAPIKKDSGSFILDTDQEGRIVARTYEAEEQGVLFTPEDNKQVAK